MAEETKSEVRTPETMHREAGRDDTKRSVKEGIGYGLIAGVIFAVVSMLASAAMGQPALSPFRMYASVIFGAGALEFTAGTALVAGGITHLLLSAVFGVIYGLIMAAFPLGTHTSFGSQSGFGLLFGAALWLVNFQIIARIGYPWFLDANQLLQLVLHAVFFGLPLGLMYAASERRALLRPRAAPEPA